jgi:cytochrome c oxidase subunit 2
MFAQLPLFPEQASTSAVSVDRLFFFVLSITGFFAVLITVLVIRFAIKYRRRSEDEEPRPVVGSLALETLWSVIPLGLALVIFAWGTRVYFDLARPPDDARQVYVVGRQWMWKLYHAEGQSEINELHVPVDEAVKLTMISEDVIHSFYVPAFRIKQDVLPGRYTTTWFHATRPGRYHLFCAEYCGTEHSRMIGTVVVLERAEFQQWLQNRAEGSLALQGRKLFLQHQCVSCHSADAGAIGPVLEDLYGRTVPLEGGQTVKADDRYLRESILEPDQKIVAGFRRPSIMPSYKDRVNETELFQLLAFLKALRAGQTPSRNESSATPVRAGTPQ